MGAGLLSIREQYANKALKMATSGQRIPPEPSAAMAAVEIALPSVRNNICFWAFQ